MSIVSRPGASSKWYFWGILIGMGITLKKLLVNLFNQDQLPTYNYPEEKYEYGPRFKGNHILTVKEDGSLRCTACMLCATNCPASCIDIIAAEHQNPEVEKFPVQYNIDILRCVFCGFCEEACPVDAIRMGPDWQTPALNGDKVIYDIEFLSRRPQLKGGALSKVDDHERKRRGL